MLFMIQNVVCDKARVGDVLLALGPFALIRPEPVPMMNAQVIAGRLVSITAPGTGDMASLFVAWAQEKGYREVSSKEARAFLEEHGKSATSYSYLFANAEKKGLLRRFGKKDKFGTLRYEVIGAQRLLPPPAKRGKNGNGRSKSAEV